MLGQQEQTIDTIDTYLSKRMRLNVEGIITRMMKETVTLLNSRIDGNYQSKDRRAGQDAV